MIKFFLYKFYTDFEFFLFVKFSKWLNSFKYFYDLLLVKSISAVLTKHVQYFYFTLNNQLYIIPLRWKCYNNNKQIYFLYYLPTMIDNNYKIIYTRNFFQSPSANLTQGFSNNYPSWTVLFSNMFASVVSNVRSLFCVLFVLQLCKHRY